MMISVDAIHNIVPTDYFMAGFVVFNEVMIYLVSIPLLRYLVDWIFNPINFILLACIFACLVIVFMHVFPGAYVALEPSITLAELSLGIIIFIFGSAFLFRIVYVALRVWLLHARAGLQSKSYNRKLKKQYKKAGTPVVVQTASEEEPVVAV